MGERSGEVYFDGIPIENIASRKSAAEIGFVMQNPDSQIVTDKVWHELAFGLENLGLPEQVIRRRTAETASYFGISSWYRQDTANLSGGQKQLLNLASVMIMQPRILILDEPTSQLDPIAAEEFITMLKKLNSELGITIRITEHRLENVFPIADRVVVMENGRIIACNDPRKIGNQMKNHSISHGFPAAVRIFQGLDINDQCPLTIKEGRNFLIKNYVSNPQKSINILNKLPDSFAVETKNLWFRYEKSSADIIKGISIKIHTNEIFSILGETGAGKTTLLNIISGLKKPYRGGVKIFGQKLSEYKSNSLYKNNLAYLPQNPLAVFIKDSIRKDFEYLLKSYDFSEKNIENKIHEISERLNITSLA